MAECPGVYRLSHVRDGALARIRIPGGIVTSGQLRTIADIAVTFGNGLIDLTNRANLQLRGLRGDDAPAVARRLTDAGLLTPDPDIDRVRNITASPLAGLDDREIINVRPCVAALDGVLQRNAAAKALSPKFSFVVDGGGRGDMAAIGYDIGFFAVNIANVPAFTIGLAGKRTKFAVVVDDIAAFADAAMTQVATASHDCMADCLTHENAHDRVEKIAIEACIDLLAAPACKQSTGRIPIGHRAGPSAATSWFTIGIPLARLNSTQMTGIAGLADQGDSTVRLTPWQSIILPHIPERVAQRIGDHAGRLDLDVREPAVHVIACAGASGCNRTEADTKTAGHRLIAMLRDRTGHAPTGAPLTVHLSGCSRGCACPGPSDILALAASGSANYAIHADSRPSMATAGQPLLSDVAPDALVPAIGEILQSGR